MGGLAKVTNLCREDSAEEMTSKQALALSRGHIQPFPASGDSGGSAYDCGKRTGCTSQGSTPNGTMQVQTVPSSCPPRRYPLLPGLVDQLVRGKQAQSLKF